MRSMSTAATAASPKRSRWATECCRCWRWSGWAPSPSPSTGGDHMASEITHRVSTRIPTPRSTPHDDAPTVPIRIPTPPRTPHDDAPTTPIRVPRTPYQLPEKPAARRAAAVRVRTCLRLLVVPLAIAAVQAPWWSKVLVQWPQPGALDALLAVPLLAGLVGWRSLRAIPRGPQIHDR